MLVRIATGDRGGCEVKRRRHPGGEPVSELRSESPVSTRRAMRLSGSTRRRSTLFDQKISLLQAFFPSWARREAYVLTSSTPHVLKFSTKSTERGGLTGRVGRRYP